MKSLFAFGLSAILACVLSVPVSAQSFGGRANALGGAGTAHVLSHPLGGFTGVPGAGFGRGVTGNRGNRGYPGYVYPYAYSFYVPNYSDYSDYYGYSPYVDGGAYAPAYYAPPPPVASGAPQQPVIINQYFGSQGPEPVSAPDAKTSDTQAPGDPIGTPHNYYLIAYKNHTVYSALAYWVEDKTLNYVTTENQHNQASLDLIDLKLTKSLNQDRDVPFSIPGE